MENNSTEVPKEAKQVEEVEALRPKTEPSIWTDSMLKALVKGVKGDKWYSLIDKVWRRKTLREAFRRVQTNDGAPGVDHQTIEDYERHLEANLQRLSKKLKEGSWEPSPVRRTWIPKPGRAEERPLGIPTIEDRVVQMALKMVIEPIFEYDFARQSYGFRPERGAKDALRRVDTLVEGGHKQVVDADLKSYFDTIPHDRLMERVSEKISDGRVLELITKFLKAEVVDGDKQWQPERGTPQGGVISPLLANIYLDPLDQIMAEKGYEMVRYADDFVILCETEKQARKALEAVEEWTEANGLKLHPDKTHIADARGEEGFEFLGYQFHKGLKEPGDKSVAKFKDKIRERTPRTDGRSLETIIEDINEVSKGWFEYFKHSYWNVFPGLDGFIRRRLRSILRKRNKLGGHTSPRDSQRWPNVYFAEHGMFAMTKARDLIKQSLR